MDAVDRWYDAHTEVGTWHFVLWRSRALRIETYLNLLPKRPEETKKGQSSRTSFPIILLYKGAKKWSIAGDGFQYDCVLAQLRTGRRKVVTVFSGTQ